jgi:hypothetical protein
VAIQPGKHYVRDGRWSEMGAADRSEEPLRAEELTPRAVGSMRNSAHHAESREKEAILDDVRREDIMSDFDRR